MNVQEHIDKSSEDLERLHTEQLMLLRKAVFSRMEKRIKGPVDFCLNSHYNSYIN